VPGDQCSLFKEVMAARTGLNGQQLPTVGGPARSRLLGAIPSIHRFCSGSPHTPAVTFSPHGSKVPPAVPILASKPFPGWYLQVRENRDHPALRHPDLLRLRSTTRRQQSRGFRSAPGDSCQPAFERRAGRATRQFRALDLPRLPFHFHDTVSLSIRLLSQSVVTSIDLTQRT
jgi:hypothetical protein